MPETETKELSAEDKRRAAAAVEIQRHFRGHRERRQLRGHRLTPNQRWSEALYEAQYRNLANPVTAEEKRKRLSSPEGENQKSSQLWGKAVGFARQAQHDDAVSETSSSSSESDSEIEIKEDEKRKKKEEKRRQKALKRQERAEHARAMDLQYFLEMIDLKHRYGSNLRTYHQYWQLQDTKENFFYWLDYGEGKDVDLTICSRQRLDSEKVRYLSKEERQAYLVKIDKEGRLCWAKNGKRIDTTEQYKDSPAGIVPADTPDSETTVCQPSNDQTHQVSRRSSDNSFSSSSSSSNSSTSEEAERYTNKTVDAKGKPKKVVQVSASTILNRLLRKTVKKNTWIFVADVSFRLYVGIKQSGAFQHSSFLHGARVSAAGLIKIKDGKLKSLAPLSGHYRPPASNFRRFVHSLRDSGVDMSGVSISKSYAVLAGMEVYGNVRQRKKKVKKAVKGKMGTLEPKRKQNNENVKDENDSISEAREALDKKFKAEEKKRDDNTMAFKLLQKLNIKPREPKKATT